MRAPDFDRFQAEHVTAGGHRTRYIASGPAAGPVVLLIHDGAFGTDAELCWADVIGHLDDRYRVFAPELLGWGGTDKVVDFGATRYESQTRHLEAFCRAVGIAEEPLTVVGTSFGGSVAVRMISDPGATALPLTAAVSICGTGGPFRRVEALQALGDYTPTLDEARRIARLIMSPAEPTEAAVRRRYLNSLISGHWEAVHSLQLRNPSRQEQREHSSDAPRRGSRFPDAFKDASVPVLLIEGTEDQVVEAGWSDTLAALSPQASNRKIRAGHSPNIDQPAEIGTLISDFVSDVIS